MLLLKCDYSGCDYLEALQFTHENFLDTLFSNDFSTVMNFFVILNDQI